MAETGHYSMPAIVPMSLLNVPTLCRTCASRSFQLSRWPPSSMCSSWPSAPQLPGTPHHSVDTHTLLTKTCSYHLQTFLLALLLSLLTYFPTAYVLGSPSIAMFMDGHADVMLRFTWVRIFAEFKRVHVALPFLTFTNPGIGHEQTLSELSCIL